MGKIAAIGFFQTYLKLRSIGAPQEIEHTGVIELQFFNSEAAIVSLVVCLMRRTCRSSRNIDNVRILAEVFCPVRATSEIRMFSIAG